MGAFTYKVTIPKPIGRGEPQKFGRLLDQNVTKMLNDVGMSVLKTVRDPIVRHSGADSLYNSIKLDHASAGDLTVRVATSSPKAIWREVDTRAHIIVPVRAKALRFLVRGKVVFAKLVHHPGTRGTHSWQHGAQAMKMRLQWGLKYAVEAALKGAHYGKRYS